MGSVLTGFEPSRESLVINHDGLSQLLAQQANWAMFIFRCTKCLKLSKCGVLFSVAFFVFQKSLGRCGVYHWTRMGYQLYIAGSGG